MSRQYVPAPERERMRIKHTDTEANAEIKRMEAIQHLAMRRNAHNFRQLSRAGFPGRIPIEFIQWTRTPIGTMLMKMSGMQKIKRFPPHGYTAILLDRTEMGYYIPLKPARDEKGKPKTDWGDATMGKNAIYDVALTTDGRLFVAHNGLKEDGCIQVNTGLSDNPFLGIVNDSVDLHHFHRGDSAASDAEKYKMMLAVTSRLVTGLEDVTRETLKAQNIPFEPFDPTSVEIPEYDEHGHVLPPSLSPMQNPAASPTPTTAIRPGQGAQRPQTGIYTLPPR